MVCSGHSANAELIFFTIYYNPKVLLLTINKPRDHNFICGAQAIFFFCITLHLSTLNFIYYFIAQSHSLFRSLCNSSQSAFILTTLNNCVSTANLITYLTALPLFKPIYVHVYKQWRNHGTPPASPMCCSNLALTPCLSPIF